MKTNLKNGKTIKSLLAGAMLSLTALTSQAQSTCFANITTTSVDSSGTAIFSYAIGGSIPDYQYVDYGDGTTAMVTPTGVMSHTYTCNGTYQVSFSIGSNDSLCYAYASDSVVITNLQPCNSGTTCNLVANFTTMVDSNDTTGLTYIFTNTSTGAHANPTWNTWYFGDGTMLNAGGSWQPVSHTYAQAGGYIVSLTAQDTGLINCMNTYTDSILVTADSSIINYNCATAQFYVYRDSTSILPLWNVYPAFSNPSSGLPITATWFWGDGSSSTGLYPSHTYATAGMYTICLTITDSCGTDSACINQYIYRYASTSTPITVNVINPNAPTALKTTINKTLVSMYPNPANSKLTVSIAQNDNSVITMYDAIGKQVMQQKATGLLTELNVSNLPQGMYFVNVNGTTQKVVISE